MFPLQLLKYKLKAVILQSQLAVNIVYKRLS